MMANKIKKQFRLLSIELENFQSFTDPVKIDFSPITLFYGPNSAGKSAVFDAIELMKLIWDPNKANSNLIINHLDKWAHKPKSGSNAQRKTRVAISFLIASTAKFRIAFFVWHQASKYQLPR